jgi:hypothetical protein
MGVWIVVGSILLSLLIAMATHGHVLVLALPLLFGLPIAALFRGRR